MEDIENLSTCVVDFTLVHAASLKSISPSLNHLAYSPFLLSVVRDARATEPHSDQRLNSLVFTERSGVKIQCSDLLGTSLNHCFDQVPEISDPEFICSTIKEASVNLFRSNIFSMCKAHGSEIIYE